MTPVSLSTPSASFADLPDETVLNVMAHSQNHAVVRLAGTDRRLRRIVGPELDARLARVRQAQRPFTALTDARAEMAARMSALHQLRGRYEDLSPAQQATLHGVALDIRHPNALEATRTLITGLALMSADEQTKLVRFIRERVSADPASIWLLPFGDLAPAWGCLHERARAELRPVFVTIPHRPPLGLMLQAYTTHLSRMDGQTRRLVLSALGSLAGRVAEPGDAFTRFRRLQQALIAAVGLRKGEAGPNAIELGGIFDCFRSSLAHMPRLRPPEAKSIASLLVDLAGQPASLPHDARDGAVGLLCAPAPPSTLRNEVLLQVTPQLGGFAPQHQAQIVDSARHLHRNGRLYRDTAAALRAAVPELASGL